MSNKRLTAVWEYSRQKGTSLLALLSLADRADDDGFCWPSHRDTAQRARTSKEYTSTIIRELVEAGELYRHERPGKTYQYLVIVGMTYKEVDEALFRRFGYDVEKRKEILENIAKCWGLQFSGGVGTGGGVGLQSTSGVGLQSTIDEPSLNPQYEPSFSEPEKIDKSPESILGKEITELTKKIKANKRERMTKDELTLAASGVGEKDPYQELPPDVQDILREFGRCFGRPFIRSEKSDWIKTARQWLELGIKPEHIKPMFQTTKNGALSVARPGSITWAFDNIQESSIPQGQYRRAK